MCQSRLQTIYKAKYVCTHCEKAFKETDIYSAMGSWVEQAKFAGKVCPDCKQVMEAVSRDFRAPRKGAKQWSVLRKLQLNGERIMYTHGCGCVSDRFVPKSNWEMKQYVETERLSRKNINRYRVTW